MIQTPLWVDVVGALDGLHESEQLCAECNLAFYRHLAACPNCAD